MRFVQIADPNLKNKIISETDKTVNASHNFTTPCRHEFAGSIERNHRFFNEYVRICAISINEWKENLKCFTFSYNISSHASFDDKFSPHELIFSRKANLPYHLTGNTIVPIYNLENFAIEANIGYNAHVRLRVSYRISVKSATRINAMN